MINPRRHHPYRKREGAYSLKLLVGHVLEGGIGEDPGEGGGVALEVCPQSLLGGDLVQRPKDAPKGA